MFSYRDTIGKNKNSPFSSHDRNYHHPRSRGSSFTPACPTGSSSHQFPPEQQQHQRHHSVPVPLPRKLLHSDPTSSNQTQPLPPQHLAPSVFSPSPTAPSTQREQEVSIFLLLLCSRKSSRPTQRFPSLEAVLVVEIYCANSTGNSEFIICI